MGRKRKVPLRKCVVTNELKPKHEMIRVVRTKEGDVFIDPTGKKNGRGAYISKQPSLIQRAKEQNILQQTFRVTIDDTLYDDLKKYAGDKDG